MQDYLYYFKYSDHPFEEADPDTTFFTFDKDTRHNYHKLQCYGGFKWCNAFSMARVLDLPSDQNRPAFSFSENYPVVFEKRIACVSDLTKVVMK